MTDYDVIVIGGGPGGYEAAFEGARQGLQVAIVEEKELGGVCLHSGCIPTKTYYHYAHMIHGLKELNGLGIEGELGVQWEQMKAYKNQVVKGLTDQLTKEAARLGVTCYSGRGSVVGAHEVRVVSSEVEEMIMADYIIEATGSVEIKPQIDGIEHCLMASELLDVEQIPEHLVIIGAGVIGMEMASIFNALGAKVTVIEKTKTMLSSFDQGLVKRLKPSIKKQGIRIFFESEVLSIDRVPDEGVPSNYSVAYQKGGTIDCVEASVVLCAVGRKTPLEVGDNRTKFPNVIRVGDCAGKTYLAHDARKQGIMAIRTIMNKSVVDESVKVQVAFTIPPIAETYREPKAKQVSNCTVTHFKTSGMALAEHAINGVCLIKTNELYNQLDYMGIMGEQAQELIHIGIMAMERDVAPQELSNMLYAHPSLSEVVGESFGRLNL